MTAFIISCFYNLGVCSGESSLSKPAVFHSGKAAKATPVITLDIMFSGLPGSLHRIRRHTDQSVRDATLRSPPQLSLSSTVASWIDS